LTRASGASTPAQPHRHGAAHAQPRARRHAHRPHGHLLRQRASAGLLIISEATAISPQGQGYADVPGLYGTEQLDGWKQVTDAVHAAGGRIVVQLWHVGRISHVDLQPGGAKPVAPSAIRANTKTVLIKDGVPTFTDTSEPRALDAAELPGIVQDYRHAARNAIAAGFDGVEIHGANGYLIDQFLKTGSQPAHRRLRRQHRRTAPACCWR
jgi:N-ethylmaleimide reductase